MQQINEESQDCNGITVLRDIERTGEEWRTKDRRNSTLLIENVVREERIEKG